MKLCNSSAVEGKKLIGGLAPGYGGDDDNDD